jgi:hypothetical protein
MSQSSDDPALRELARLMPAAPDAVHSASVRARCHAALARRRRRQDADVERPLGRGRLLELVVVGGVALLYVSLVVRDALAVHAGFWPR